MKAIFLSWSLLLYVILNIQIQMFFASELHSILITNVLYIDLENMFVMDMKHYISYTKMYKLTRKT